MVNSLNFISHKEKNSFFIISQNDSLLIMKKSWKNFSNSLSSLIILVDQSFGDIISTFSFEFNLFSLIKITFEFFKIENELEFHTYGLRLLYKIKFEELGKVENNF